MISDAALDPTGEPKPFQPPSTAGMTTKVVKGSMWTLAGQIAPFAVTFISTPFVIRFLGSEGYGVLLLVGLIPMYFGFADLGMGIASTKYSSEAYGEGDSDKERDVVWTAAAIALTSSVIVAVPLFVFSSQIVNLLNVPSHLATVASIGLKLSSIAFVLGLLGMVVNSPMLSRLRMDLNSVTQAVPKILLAAVTPVVLYLGGGIVGAVAWSLVVAIGTLAAILYFSATLLPSLTQGKVRVDLIRPMLKFGGGWVVGMIAAVMLVNLDKLLLTRMESVTALAHYSIAFTFANTATLFASAMFQSMVPAFSQLNRPEKQGEFDTLFSRAVRLNLLWIFPAVAVLFVIAKPFFTLWAGPEFGEESTGPFYILLLGLIVSIPAYVPYAAIAAKGRTDASAKLYWIELLLYAIALLILIRYFGIVGAAISWSFRMLFDAVGLFTISRRIGVKGKLFDSLIFGSVALLTLAPIPFVRFFFDAPIFVLFGVTAVCLLMYCVIVWRNFIQRGEQEWLIGTIRGYLRRS